MTTQTVSGLEVSAPTASVHQGSFANRFQASQVILFSGHMMDAPDRPVPRFPPAMESDAAARIAAALDELDAGPDDIALSQAASGGDLLFLEAALQRQIRCQVLLPFDETTFLQCSVLPSQRGEQWLERYFAIKEQLTLPILLMPDELGPDPEGVDPFERCNLWLLESAMAAGGDQVRLITLWNGGGGDGPGGTAHMVREVENRSGRVSWIDTRSLACT